MEFLKVISPPICRRQQATKVEMCINLKTARAVGITIPLPLSGRADEIFE
jgi:putative ABC transport system substrate-binding protein